MFIYNPIQMFGGTDLQDVNEGDDEAVSLYTI